MGDKTKGKIKENLQTNLPPSEQRTTTSKDRGRIREEETEEGKRREKRELLSLVPYDNITENI